MKQIECVARVRMLTTTITERCGASIGTTPTRPLPCRTCNRQPLMIWCVVILKKLSYLKVQPVGSEPSNLGTSSFRQCVEPVIVGVCSAEEDGGVYGGCWFASSCVILCRRSSIFVFIASWDADSFAMASSNRSVETLERVASAIDAQWKHQCYDLDFEDQGPRLVERRKEGEKRNRV